MYTSITIRTLSGSWEGVLHLFADVYLCASSCCAHGPARQFGQHDYTDYFWILLICVPCASAPAHAFCARGAAMQLSHPLRSALIGHTAGMNVCAHGQAIQYSDSSSSYLWYCVYC